MIIFGLTCLPSLANLVPFILSQIMATAIYVAAINATFRGFFINLAQVSSWWWLENFSSSSQPIRERARRQNENHPKFSPIQRHRSSLPLKWFTIERRLYYQFLWFKCSNMTSLKVLWPEVISRDLDQTIVNRFLVISCKNTSTVD